MQNTRGATQLPNATIVAVAGAALAVRDAKGGRVPRAARVLRVIADRAVPASADQNRGETGARRVVADPVVMIAAARATRNGPRRSRCPR